MFDIILIIEKDGQVISTCGRSFSCTAHQDLCSQEAPQCPPVCHLTGRGTQVDSFDPDVKFSSSVRGK